MLGKSDSIKRQALYYLDWFFKIKKLKQSFQDPIFKADNHSISIINADILPRNLKWIHLIELSANAEIFQEKRTSSFDVHQVGFSWILSIELCLVSNL